MKNLLFWTLFPCASNYFYINHNLTAACKYLTLITRMFSSSKERRNRCETLTCTRENFSCSLTTLSSQVVNSTQRCKRLSSQSYRPILQIENRGVQKSACVLTAVEKNNRVHQELHLKKLSCCPEYWKSIPFYQLLVGFLSLLERVVYFLQISKYQRTGFKKQDYCSGIYSTVPRIIQNFEDMFGICT